MIALIHWSLSEALNFFTSGCCVETKQQLFLESYLICVGKRNTTIIFWKFEMANSQMVLLILAFCTHAPASVIHVPRLPYKFNSWKSQCNKRWGNYMKLALCPLVSFLHILSSVCFWIVFLCELSEFWYTIWTLLRGKIITYFAHTLKQVDDWKSWHRCSEYLTLLDSFQRNRAFHALEKKNGTTLFAQSLKQGWYSLHELQFQIAMIFSLIFFKILPSQKYRQYGCLQ